MHSAHNGEKLQLLQFEVGSGPETREALYGC